MSKDFESHFLQYWEYVKDVIDDDEPEDNEE